MNFLEVASSEHVEMSFNIPSAEDVQELRKNRCYLTVSGFSKRLTMFLPRFVTRLVKPTPYNQYGFTEYASKKYGIFCCADTGSITLYYGPQYWNVADDNYKSAHVSWDPPWQFHHVRNDVYMLDGTRAFPAHHLRMWSRDHLKLTSTGTSWSDWISYPESEQRVHEHEKLWFRSNAPYDNWSQTSFRPDYIIAAFRFKDPYDQEPITGYGYIEEREWIRGKWSWLRAMLRYVPGCRLVRRSMEITFDKGIGKRKSSWKGGIISMGVNMLPGETGNECIMRIVTRPDQCLSR